jgi:hypothetical protein
VPWAALKIFVGFLLLRRASTSVGVSVRSVACLPERDGLSRHISECQVKMARVASRVCRLVRVELLMCSKCPRGC